MNAGLTLRVAADPRELGPEWDPLFAGAAGLQSSRAWFAATIAAAVPAGAEPRLLALYDDAGPLALCPMLAGPGRLWSSLTTPYTCLYQPPCRPEALSLTLGEFGRYCRQWPVTRIEALDPAWPGVDMLRRSFASAGLASRTFVHFGNWYEPIATSSWEDYLRARPGALRETIRRRTRAAERAGARIEIAREGASLAAALEAYEAVYRRSWKAPEPFPAFNATLIQALADTGALRIGVMWIDATPIAAQYWSVANGSASVLKLAHDDQFKAVSPGTVLTAATIRELVTVDRVAEVDFGRGDDPYKRQWARHRRPRIGLLGLDPWTPAGLRTMMVHDSGKLLRTGRAALDRRRRSRHAET